MASSDIGKENKNDDEWSGDTEDLPNSNLDAADVQDKILEENLENHVEGRRQGHQPHAHNATPQQDDPEEVLEQAAPCR